MSVETTSLIITSMGTFCGLASIPFYVKQSRDNRKSQARIEEILGEGIRLNRGARPTASPVRPMRSPSPGAQAAIEATLTQAGDARGEVPASRLIRLALDRSPDLSARELIEQLRFLKDEKKVSWSGEPDAPVKRAQT